MNKRRNKRKSSKIRLLIIGVALLGVLVPVTVVLAVSISQPLDPRAVAPKPLPTSGDWLQAVNEARRTAGVAPLVEDPRLDASAAQKVSELASEGWHEPNPHLNAQGVEDGPQIALKAMPECEYVSENLAKTSDLALGMSSLMASPPHRAAILDPRYELFGAASVNGYSVQHFADCS